MLNQTITQNGALYLAQHRILKQRKSIFGHWRAPVENLRTNLPRPAFSEAYLVPRFFQNGPR